MRLVLLSDTHTLQNKMQCPVPDGDILIHAGDSTNTGQLSDVYNFADWFGGFKHKHKVVIAGNHDFAFQSRLYRDEAINALIDKKIKYLEDSLVIIKKLKIYGTPWTPIFYDWAFMGNAEALEARFSKISKNTDILVTHGPPYGILDYVRPGAPALGSLELLNRVKCVKPKVHVFGHIHGGHGSVEVDGTIFANAAICDEQYRPVYPPIVLDI